MMNRWLRLLVWLLALASPLAIAGCMGSPDDGKDAAPAIDAGQGPADAAPAADAGEGAADAAPAIDAGVDAMDPALDLDACDHMINGPSQPVNSAMSAPEDAGDVTPGHLRWESDSHLGGSGFPYGYLDLVVEQPGVIVIYHPYMEVFSLRTKGGVALVAESFEPTTCAEPILRHTYDLGAGTYSLGIGSSFYSLHLVVLRGDDPGH